MDQQCRISTREVADIYDVPPWLVDHAIPRPGRAGRIAWRLRSLVRRIGRRLR